MMRRYLLPGLLVPSLALNLITFPAQASFFNTIGNDGRDGSSGRSGRDGSSGASQTVFATPNPATIDLSGQAGEDGDDGRDAERPYCHVDRGYGRHHDDEIDYDLNGANGGNGGSGGNGGNGGSAGNLTLYYQNLTDLRNLSVRAIGGRGGRSGRGGYGSSGCRCPRRHWSVKKCTGTGAEQKCHTREYSCTDGRNGWNGAEGRDGSTGAYGQLTLINRATALPADRTSHTTTFSDWQQQPIDLSRNYWDTATGAATLFAPGAVLADRYTYLADRVERSVQLQWQAPKPLSQFANLAARFEIDAEKQVQIRLPPEFWPKSNIQQTGNAVTVSIDQVMYRQDALKLGVVGLRGSGEQLAIKLLDVALQTDRVQTGAIAVKYRVKQGDGSLVAKFTGEVPAQFVSSRANEFVLGLGQLGIEPTALQAGTTVDLEISVARSFGANRADQVIRWQGTIGALPPK
jgi:hypothetical protein